MEPFFLASPWQAPECCVIWTQPADCRGNFVLSNLSMLLTSFRGLPPMDSEWTHGGYDLLTPSATRRRWCERNRGSNGLRTTTKIKISKRTVDVLSVASGDGIFWDRELPGFGVRVYESGIKTYVVQSRGPGGSRRITLGRHGELTANRARKEAATIIDRIQQGEDPVPPPPAPVLTVADLAQRYLETHAAVSCSAHTASLYRGSLGNHILPALGTLAIDAVTRERVSALHLALRDTPRAANRALMVLSKMFSLAEAWELRPAGSNPCRFVVRYKEGKRERFLTAEEYRRVGRSLVDLEAERRVPAQAAAALRLLMLTGCRRTEILTLRWDDVDYTAGELRLRHAKSGARMVPLTPTAVAVLEGIARMPGNPWVFAAENASGRLTHISKAWYRVRDRAGLGDVRIHDLRHSFASRALALGESLTMIGRLLGHTDTGSAARYAHLARNAEKSSAAKVGGSIEADIAPVRRGTAPGMRPDTGSTQVSAA